MLCFQGHDNWAGMYANDADQPVTDKDFQEELTKTGYLIQAAYSYLGVYQENNATIGLPMVFARFAATLACMHLLVWKHSGGKGARD